MKPIYVGILVVAAAVGGGLFTKWQTSRNVAPAAAATTAVTAPAAPAEQPATVLPTAGPAQAAAQTPASEQARHSPLTGSPSSAPLSGEKPRKPGKTLPVQPRMVAQNVAQNREPEVSPAAEPAAEPAPQAPPTPQAAAAPQPEPAVPGEPAPAANVQPDLPAPPPPAPPVQVTLRAGTLLSTRTVEGLSSDRNQEGDTFTATLDQPLVVDGWVIAERGAHLEGKIVQSQRAGRVKGLSNLAIELSQLVTSDGQRIPIETETFEKRGESSTGQDAAKVGAGAAIGAAIGAMAGGGKGAAIGAAAGGAAGAGDVMITRGKPAALPAETHINFRLRSSVTISERQGRTD